MGITDVIQFTQAGNLLQATVFIDISHTYRGDLVVSLLSPEGTLVTLHERHQGGSADDLKVLYQTPDSENLEALINQNIQGSWTLRVQDLAPHDTGTLNAWYLEFSIKQSPSTSLTLLSEAPGVKIPDEDESGITRTLTHTHDQPLKDLQIEIDITHRWVSDLTVSLSSPEGIKVVLHDQAASQEVNLIKTWTISTTPELAVFLGASSAGDWQLHVWDSAKQDIGKLNRWALKLEFEN